MLESGVHMCQEAINLITVHLLKPLHQMLALISKAFQEQLCRGPGPRHFVFVSSTEMSDYGALWAEYSLSYDSRDQLCEWQANRIQMMGMGLCFL